MISTSNRATTLAVLALGLTVFLPSFATAQKRGADTSLSWAGQMAQNYVKNRPLGIGINGPGGLDDPAIAVSGGQAETSIAVDSTGMHLVVGFNDTRGFALAPNSLSGYMYSSDGGVNWTDGGQLPTNSGHGGVTAGAVFGDPEIKYLGGSTFVYFSIFVNPGGIQTMCVHRSTDFGVTWAGPFEIPSATVTVPAGTIADKEYADVDPDTGRVMMSWAAFLGGSGATVDISTTFSDDIATASPPTWSARAIAGASDINQCPSPRFAGGGSTNAYVCWNYRPGSHSVGFARSTDNGATWPDTTNTLNSLSFGASDEQLGNDRRNNFPSMAVDTSVGPFAGRIYILVPNNDNGDGADLSLFTSTDGGLTFGSPVLIGSNPGGDRGQWFPWISVDKNTGRVHAIWYDQDTLQSGDVTEFMHSYSDTGGVSWVKPAPLNERPFHAGFGNDTGQPNIGDYNQSVAQNGAMFASYAQNPARALFTDAALGTFPYPDTEVAKHLAAKLALRLGTVTFSENHGDNTVDRGDYVDFTFPLENYTVSATMSAGSISGITAVLSTTTPGVSVLQANSAYPTVGISGTVDNTTPFRIKLDATFPLGDPIDLTLTVTAGPVSTVLKHMVITGTPSLVSTPINHDFEAGTSGWTVANGAGTVDPWVRTSGVLGNATFGLYHDEGTSLQWNRLISPSFIPPAGIDFMTVDFDASYDLEDDPSFNVLAYDGAFLRITRTEGGAFSYLAEAFANEFTTGADNHYPKHLPRTSAVGYFPSGDMSVWSGDSQGTKHVAMRFDGINTSAHQLRFEYAEDSVDTAETIRPNGQPDGIIIDNVLVRLWDIVAPTHPAPVGVTESYVTFQDIPISTDAVTGVLNNDTDSDNDPLTPTEITPPQHGSLSLAYDGSFIYTPDLHYFGNDSFQYAPNDGLQDGNTVTVQIGIKPPVLTATGPASVVGGQNFDVTVNLAGTVPSNAPLGVDVTMSDNSAFLTTPASVNVPSGSSSAIVTIGTLPVTASQARRVFATTVAATTSHLVTLLPKAKLLSFTLTDSDIVGGDSINGTITLTQPANPGGASVAMSDTSTAITTPASVDLAEGDSSEGFLITTSAVNATVTRSIKATLDGVSKTVLLTLNPFYSFSISPTSIEGGNPVDGTVTLFNPATAGGQLVTVTDDSSAITTPPNVTVDETETVKMFTISTSPVTALALRRVTTNTGGLTITKTLLLQPAPPMHKPKKKG